MEITENDILIILLELRNIYRESDNNAINRSCTVINEVLKLIVLKEELK